MRVIKKLNNNVAICLDSKNRELIAFGKGIGYPNMPYELKDLSKIDRTFYDINKKYFAMFTSLPIEILELTSRAVLYASKKLDYDLNHNLVLTLADHISFAIDRQEKNIYIHMPLAYEVEQTHPQEMEISRYILNMVKKELGKILPENELSGIAMALVGARIKPKKSIHDNQIAFDNILKDTTSIIEQYMNITVDQKSFSYARFATHYRYLLQRLNGNKQITNSIVLFDSIKKEAEEVSACVDKIEEYLLEHIHHSLSNEEKTYLVLHVYRVCIKENAGEL